MRTFTSFKALLMLMLMGLFLYSPISQAQERAKSGDQVEITGQRMPLSEGAQTQPMPAERMAAKGTTFTVPADRALGDVRITVMCDSYPSEASYNLWSYDDAAYYWGSDQTFTSSYETQVLVLSLTPGSSYDFECYDSFGDGGIFGIIVDGENGYEITHWASTDYASYGVFNFMPDAGQPPLPPPTAVTSFPYMEDFESGSFSAMMTPVTRAESNVSLDAFAGNNSSYGALLEGNSYSNYYTLTGMTVEYAFLRNYDHVSKLEMTINPSGDPGLMQLEFDFLTRASFSQPNYEWFRVLVNGMPIPDADGNYYFQGSTTDDPWTHLSYDLSPYQGLSSFNLTFENAGKYYHGYYDDGDVACIDNLNMYYLTLGNVEGHVMNGDGLTVAGADVSVEGYGHTTSDATGYYSLVDIPAGDVPVVCAKDGYNTITDMVTILPVATVTHDFVLTQPNLSITPLIFDETLNPNEYLTTYMSLLNTGDGPLDWTAGVVYPEMASNPNLPVDNQPVVSNSTPSMGAIPAGMKSTGEQKAPLFLNNGSRDGANIAWISAPQGGIASYFYTMDMATYGTTQISTASGVDPASGDFMNGDASTLYVATGWGVSLSAIDVATGASTLIANFSGMPAGYSINGMACDRTTNTMYVGMSNLAGSQIGTVDLSTGVITPIGSISSVSTGLIDIAIDGSGQMYGWDLVSDASYLIDKATGTFGTLGSLGFDANFGQGGNYDADDGNIYLTAFNNTAFQGELRLLDPITGGTTYLALLPQLQMTAFGVPSAGGGGGVSGWLTLSDYSGSVAPDGGTFNIGVNFNASGTVAGEVYHANIVVGSDPFVGQVTIPVTMTIAGDELPALTGFTAELTNAVTGEVTCAWDEIVDPNFQYYLIKRDGEAVGTATVTSFVDMLPTFGTYDYTVQAVFDAGQGSPAGPETVEWYQPALCWSPAAPENTQWTNTHQDVNLELENCNNGVLEFTFPDYAARALLSDPNVQKNDASIIEEFARMPEPGKGEVDSRDGQGHPIILGAGGPDNFGYVWIDSDEAGGPVYNWIDISATGTLVTGLADDNTVGPFPISFNFPFYGVDKGQFWIGSNGTIDFSSSGQPSLSNYQIPTTNTYKDFIAWFWDDLDPGNTNTSVWYQDFGNYLVIQFDTYYEYPDGGHYINAEMILYPTGAIMINYDYIDPGMDLAGNTVGIQSSGADGLGVSYNTTYIHDGLALSFTLPAHFIIDVQPFYGTIAAGQTMDVAMTYSSDDYGVGSYMEDLFITTNEMPVNEWFIPNTMNVVMPATITGTVTDCNTGAPLNNVTITAETVTKDLEDTFTAETGSDGTYMMYVNENTDYLVTASKLGFGTESQNVSVVSTAVADFEMCEEPYPTSFVFADPNEADTQCMVTWSLPMGPYLIAYDDGTAEDYFAWAGYGSASAVKFTPAGYPATVVGGRLFVGDGSFPVGGNFLGTQMAVGVVDDDGPGGMPGTVMDSAVVTVNNYGWVDFNGMFNSSFADGDFYIVMWQLGYSPNVAPVGVDQDVPTVYRSYVKPNNGEWMVSVYNDFMIRAIVDGPGENVVSASSGQMIYPGKLSPDTYVATGTPNAIPGIQGEGTFLPVMVEAADRDFESYQVIRVSGFDPNVGETPADGVHTTLQAAYTGGESYNDTGFGGRPAGFYAYGIIVNYTGGVESEITYSNIVAHKMDNMVTINVSQCDGLSPEGAMVTMVGMNYPYQSLSATVDASGVVVFDSVINGMYNLAVVKDGYNPYYHNNLNITADHVENVILAEVTYPARDLTVEPLTSVATWKSPYVLYMQNEGFDEDTDFPPPGWAATTQGEGWFHTANGSSSFWPIPPGDGWYACVNDDANSGNVGCCDYLILPEVDLSESDGFKIQFDAYFTGDYSELATVEYSLNGGTSWTSVYDVPTASSWTTYNVELDMLAGNPSVLVAFHANDQGFWASGFAVDNVEAYTGEQPSGYYVYIDGGFVASTEADVTTYTYLNLTYGQTYEAAVRAIYSCGLSDPIYYTFVSNYLYPPRNLMDEYVYGTNEIPIMWNPPMTVAGPAPLMAGVQSELVTGSTPVLTASPTAGVVSDVEVNNPLGTRESSIAWAEDVLSNNWYTVDVDNVAVTTIGPGAFSAFCGDFPKGNADVMYGINYDDNQLIEIDVATGAKTNIAATVCPMAGTGGIFTGMATDKTTGDIYVAWTDISQSAIGTIDITNGEVTQIGSNNTDSPGCIEIAIDGTGQMYGWDIVTDMSYTIDKSTGVFTALGALGYDANYAQGGNWDPVNNQIYLASYGVSAELRILDVATGGTSVVGPLPNETGIFGFPGGGGGGSTGGTIPDGLMSFNVYKDGDMIANVPYDGEGTEDWIPYVDNNVMPGCYTYEVTAVYDLTPYGFSGTAESDFEGPDEVCAVWGFDLPFCEDFAQGFDFNGWMNSDANWTINSQDGNDAPSAQWNWDPDPGSPYSTTMSSPPFNADMLTEGNIWLDFDLALDNRNATGEEMMNVEVYDGSAWNVVATFDNSGDSYDFMPHSYDITSYAMNGVFQVRFNATGVNSFDVISWNVDNVCVYRTCEAPYNLTGEYLWNDVDDLGANVCWETNEATSASQWFYYDDESIEYVWGSTGDWDADVAIRIDPEDLADFEGAALTKYLAFVDSRLMGVGTVAVKVMQGENPDPSSPVYAEDVTDQYLLGDDWNEFTLSTPVMVDITQPLWIGMYFTGPADTYGPGITTDMGSGNYDPRGDLYYDAGAWHHLTEDGIDNRAWLIRGYVTTDYGTVELGNTSDFSNLISGQKGTASIASTDVTTTSVGVNVDRSRELSYFNIWRAMDGSEDYTVVGTVDAAGLGTYCYYDNDVDIYQTYCYKVTAVYVGDEDMCESAPAMAYDNPQNDYVCVYITDVENPDANTFSLYPNPAKEFVNISATQAMNDIKVFNYVGQVVYNSEMNGELNYVLKTSSYDAGVYIVRISTDSGVVTKRMVITK